MMAAVVAVPVVMGAAGAAAGADMTICGATVVIIVTGTRTPEEETATEDGNSLSPGPATIIGADVEVTTVTGVRTVPPPA